MKCKLYKQGPDDSSTYPECWGSTATSHGRLVAESGTLTGLVDAVIALGHENWAVLNGRKWLSPEEFFAASK